MKPRWAAAVIRRAPFITALLLALSLLAILPARRARAHANLEGSNPENGAVLDSAPGEVWLDFSEDLDPQFTNARLLEVNYRVVLGGPGEIDPTNPRRWHLSLPTLPDGVYTVQWKARSEVDGHVTYGSVGFSIGLASPPASRLPPPGTPEPATALPTPLDALLRWFAYLAACTLAGSPFFALIVWRSSGAGFDGPAGPWMQGLLARLVLFGGLGLFAATLGLVGLQASQVANGAYLPALSRYLLDRTGLLMVARLGLLLFVLGASLRLAHAAPGAPGGWLLAALLCAAILLTFSLQGHAAAASSSLALLFDWVHLLSMAIWLGGLLPLALSISHFKSSDQAACLLSLVSRFSRVALLSVAVLCLTGLYSANLQVGTLEALVATTYGRGLIVKVGLIAIWLILGAINHQVLTPGLWVRFAASTRWLQHSVTAELVFGLLVLLVVGLISASAPAQAALQAQKRLGVVQSARVGDVHLVLRVAPGLVGDDEFGVDVADPRPDTADLPATVLLRFTMLEHDMGTSQVEASHSSGSRFTARGSYLSMLGTWQVEVILRKPGFDDVTHVFQFPVRENPDQPPEPVNPLPADQVSIATGHVLYQANCLPCHGVQGKGDGPAGLALIPHPADLTVHTAPGLHSDGQLFLWITNGYPGSAMPAFGQSLSDKQRWQLVNYIRTLGR
jgi:putative copper export protein/methionine-rich copper-binding protein CopC/mono/diheme cytochrome c family protein